MYNLIRILLILFSIRSAHALVLEKLAKQDSLQQTLSNKKICFYPGSFDPPHQGHVTTARSALQYCDFVLVYPSWGADYDKNRTEVKIRIEMLFALFADDQQIIVTAFTPVQLQQALTKENGSSVFRVPLYGAKFIAIVGSDNALKSWQYSPPNFSFMKGQKIPMQYAAHTFGGLMALPIESFIVAIRENQNIDALGGKIDGRDIIGVLHNDSSQALSSSQIRNSIQTSATILQSVDQRVMQIIAEHQLYHN